MKLRIIFLSSLLLFWISLYSQKVIEVPIFNTKVLIFNKLNPYLKYTNQQSINDSECETIEMESEFVSYIKDSTCLDHELIHVTWFILNYYGVHLTSDNHEIQCYLFEYLKSSYLK